MITEREKKKNSIQYVLNKTIAAMKQKDSDMNPQNRILFVSNVFCFHLKILYYTANLQILTKALSIDLFLEFYSFRNGFDLVFIA